MTHRFSGRSPRRSLAVLALAGTSMALTLAACSGGGTPQSAGHARPGSAAASLGSPAPTADPPTPAPTTTLPPPTTTTVPPLPSPAPLTPLVSPPLPGEGIWQPAGNQLAGGFALYTTHLRPAPGQPEVGVAWIDSVATRTVLYAGNGEPAGSWPDQGFVSPAAQPSLLAAFNSGFRINSYRTGWYDHGVTAMPLQPGAASLVIFANGQATVGVWGRDVGPGPNVAAVRQNLTLLVDHGAPTPGAADPSLWGAVLGGGPVTWRSGLGVTAAGNLVYVGGPGLTPELLATTLVAAGARRAMELDINPNWVSFATFSHSTTGTISGSNLLPGTFYAADHYLTPYWRDFIAVFSR